MTATTTATMNAVAYHRYGAPDVVAIERVPRPAAGEHDVIVRVRAATVGAADSAARAGSPFFARLFFGPLRPRLPVLGSDFAGVVEEVGASVTRWAVGDEVIGVTSASLGSHAEYVRVSDDGAMVRKPRRFGFEDAASLAELTALPFLRDAGRVTAGTRLLVNGASGSVGASAVQLAKHLGAHVTAVCSGANIDLVRSLGADEVIDYTVADFTAGTARYDVVFDAVGMSSFARCRRILTATGSYLGTVPSLGLLMRTAFAERARGRRAVILLTGLRPTPAQLADLEQIVGLAELGAVVPVVDSTYPASRAAEAHARVDSGRKRGNVILTFP